MIAAGLQDVLVCALVSEPLAHPSHFDLLVGEEGRDFFGIGSHEIHIGTLLTSLKSQRKCGNYCLFHHINSISPVKLQDLIPLAAPSTNESPWLLFGSIAHLTCSAIVQNLDAFLSAGTKSTLNHV